jgi:hypothetical protein
MKCDVCGREVANSEELARHKEEKHPPASDEGRPSMPLGDSPRSTAGIEGSEGMENEGGRF